jgi:hypothetical protein
MRLVSRTGGSFCSLRLRTFGPRGLMAKVEVSDLGLHGVTTFMPVEVETIQRFLAELAHFSVDLRGEVTLHCASAHDEARIRVYTLDRARHVGVDVALMRSQNLQSQYSENTIYVTFELDPSCLPACLQALATDLASVLTPD